MPTATRSLASDVDSRIAAAIRNGRGVASLDDLQAAGVARRSVRERVRSGRLDLVFRDVVAFPQDRLYPSTRRRAALLSCRPGALLGGWSAAEQHELVTFQVPRDPRPVVVVPRGRRVTRADIAVERLDTLAAADVTVQRGLPCLSIPRLLLDLARREPPRLLQRLADEAAYLRRWDDDAVRALLERSHRAPGAATLRAALAGHIVGSTRTMNDLEEAFLAISDARGWPRPVCQFPVTLLSGIVIHPDFVWPDLRLAAETDGGRGHAGERRRRRDAERDAQLLKVGIATVRVRWDEVFHDVPTVVGRVEPELHRRGWR